MAWIDDRIWCHTKLTDLSDKAFRVWISSIAYSAGLGTKGHLSEAQQRLVGATPRVRNELIEMGLWDRNGSEKTGEIFIHDWNEHNAKRDARREADRLRKRLQRQMSAGQSAGTSSGASTRPARVEGSEGSDIPKDPLRTKVKCPQCKTEFKSQRTLALHIQNVHDGPPVPLTTEEATA